MSQRVDWINDHDRDTTWSVVATIAFCAVGWSDTVCRSCGKVKYVDVSGVATSGPGPPTSYRTISEVLIVYSGSMEMRFIGCASGNRYIFLPGNTRRIDENDANCLLQLKEFQSAIV